jgi:ParB family chromosome partitioning protein
MVTTRGILASIESHLLESMGSRTDAREPSLAPLPQAKDVGRRPVPGFGSVDIDQVIPDPEQPRTEFSPDALQRLAESIRNQGQLAPIRVRWSDEVGKWLIIAGERRWRAAKLAALPAIECYFHTTELSRSEILEQQLIENLLREDLKPVEAARGFKSLMQLNKWNGKQVAQQLRIPESQVSRALALLRLPEDIQQRVDAGDIPARAAYELSKLDDEQQQRQLQHLHVRCGRALPDGGFRSLGAQRRTDAASGCRTASTS